VLFKFVESWELWFVSSLSLLNWGFGMGLHRSEHLMASGGYTRWLFFSIYMLCRIEESYAPVSKIWS
jgi:hypothetical protein